MEVYLALCVYGQVRQVEPKSPIQQRVQVSALGPVPVKGLEEPVEVFELVGASGVRRRLQAAAARSLTPFVGRQQELVMAEFGQRR